VLLLLTIALVLVGALSLVIGFVGGSQAPIFISIACSLLAGGVLVVFSRMSRRSAAPATGGPAPLTGDGAPATQRQAAVSDAEVEEAVSEPEPVSAGRSPGAFSAGEFPIEDYDELLVSEILPLLAELDVDELDLVRVREQDGKARATLLRRIEQLGEGEGEPTAAVPAFAARGAAEEDDGGDEDEELMFPIEDYDDLRVSEILPLLPELYDDELELVAERERDGANRASVLNRIDDLLGGEEPAPAPKKAAAKKAAPKKAAAKKAAAKRAVPKKAAPAKKAAPRKATPVKRTAAATKRTATPAKKAASSAKKTATATKKTAAKKATARRR
jgi:hypothetical protein